MAAERIPPPNACRWCDQGQRDHYRRYTDAAGWHGWVEPTDVQRLARMRARRAARLAPKAQNGPPAPETAWTLSVDASRLGSACEAVREALRGLAAVRGWETA